MTTNNPTDAFIAKNLDLIELLKKLTTAAEDHFDMDPEDITWTNVEAMELVLSHVRAAAGRMRVE